MTERPFAKAVVVAVFFLSGAVGLMFEVLWTRQLALIFGVSTYAVATVLATYMGGLALGSYVLGRWGDRHTNPLMAYAMMEVGIGLYALVVPFLFAALRGPYVYLYGLDLPGPVLVLARVVLAAIVLLPPTTLMGGTFPILARFWVSAPGGVGLGVAIFLDATVVRLVLVPAVMELLGDANWWFPGWLDRLLPRVQIEGSTAGPMVVDANTDRN